MSQQVHRREFCQWNLQGLGSIALLDLLRRDGLLGQEGAVAGGLHHPPRVKRAIQICLVGGMSHVDSYDYKPELSKQQGKSLPAAVKPDIFFGKVGLLRGSDWEFRQRGESGLWVSEMFPEIVSAPYKLCLCGRRSCKEERESEGKETRTEPPPSPPYPEISPDLGSGGIKSYL